MLLQMSLAPKDGTKIIIKTDYRGYVEYFLCHWLEPYSTCFDGGAWIYLENESVSVILPTQALGWIPEPDEY